jgi:hypothetical protein
MRDVDEIIQSIKNMDPRVEVRQLKVSHPGADDDGIWFFDRPNCQFQVQIESHDGMCPFVIETDESDARVASTSVEQTVVTLTKFLHLKPCA